MFNDDRGGWVSHVIVLKVMNGKAEAIITACFRYNNMTTVSFQLDLLFWNVERLLMFLACKSLTAQLAN